MQKALDELHPDADAECARRGKRWVHAVRWEADWCSILWEPMDLPLASSNKQWHESDLTYSRNRQTQREACETSIPIWGAGGGACANSEGSHLPIGVNLPALRPGPEVREGVDDDREPYRRGAGRDP